MNNVTSPHTMSFGAYLAGTLIRPRQTFNHLLADDRRLKLGFTAMCINAAVYTLIYIFLTLRGGAPSTFEPFLAVPKDVYYFYNQFWLLPSMFGCWILASGVAHLLSRLASGKGSFEDTLTVFGFGITVATLIAALHDLTDSFLGAVGLLDIQWYEVALNTPTIWRTILWTAYGTALIMLFVLLIQGIRAAHKLKPGTAILIGSIAAVIYQGVFVIFNR